MKKISPKEYKKGAVIITTTLFFLIITATIILGLTAPTIRQIKATSDLLKSRNSYFLAEAGMEDVLYRLKNAIPTQVPQTVTIDGYTVTSEIFDNITGKTVVSTANWNGHVRKVETKVVAGVGASFNYGVQTGNGGFLMDNNAGVNGNVYSNGDIIGSSNTFITGTAIAANSAALTTDQANEGPAVPSNSIDFRNSSATQDFAQSFALSTTSPINKIELYLKKTGTPSNATVRIVTNSGSNPGTVTLTTGTLSASTVTTNYGWVTVTFGTNVLLTQGTTYWLVVDSSSNSASNYYTIGANAAYTDGQAKVGQYSGTWTNTSPAGLDSYFRIYLGGVTSEISNIIVGTAGVGNAHAHTVNNVTVHGNLYCQEGSGNQNETGGSISCDTSVADPVPQAFPLSEGNIIQWKDDALAGGVINGNYTPTGDFSTLGPKKIEGNLVLPDNHTLTITGTVWVAGNVIAPNNNIIQLASGYGNSSGIVITDGYIRFDNNVSFEGSGSANSYVFFISTSSCPNAANCSGYDAIELVNNVGQDGDEVVVYAQNGTIDFNNNALVKMATGYKIHLSNNVTITYVAGLANVNFSSGPGGTWNITSWKEIE